MNRESEFTIKKIEFYSKEIEDLFLNIEKDGIEDTSLDKLEEVIQFMLSTIKELETKN